MFTYATVGHATTNTLTGLCLSSHETAMASTWNHANHMPYHTTAKQSPSNNGSNGQGHGQALQLQAAYEEPKIQKSMEGGLFSWECHRVLVSVYKQILEHT
jgi:hypothetical protein